MKVLGIESSCDETAAGIYQTDIGIIASKLFSQIELHKVYGGVVPELASRSHLEKINSVVQETLNIANLSLNDIDVVAVTNGPGLSGSLHVGLGFSKGIAFALNKKIIGVNHLEGHVFSSFIENNVPFPHICITASGGHSSIYLVHGFGDFELIAQTLDDAAGEAFDKIAKLIGLAYPGGPAIEKLAQSMDFVDFFNYPRSTSSILDFSFSGLKTAVLYDLVKKGAYDLAAKKFLCPEDDLLKAQVSSSFLVCMADIFEKKLQLVLRKYKNAKAISFVGGVACNSYIKEKLAKFAYNRDLQFFSPSPKYCTDNGAMIAFVGHYKALQNKFDNFNLDINI